MSDDYKGNKWKTMPKGWSRKSRKEYWESLTDGVKHPVTKCIKEMEGNVDDPGAFCASLQDRIKGTTKWRGEDRKKKASNGVISLHPNMTIHQIAQMIGGHLTHGPGRMSGRLMVLDPHGLLDSTKSSMIHDKIYDEIIDGEQKQWQRSRGGYYDAEMEEIYRELVHENLEIRMSRIPVTNFRSGWRFELFPTVAELEEAARNGAGESEEE